MGVKRRYELLVAFVVLAGTLLLASLAWACTLLVGSTQTTTPTGSFGDPVHATGEVLGAEEISPQCPEGLGNYCDYKLVIIDPADVADSDAGEGGSPSCHYDTHERGVADSEPTVLEENETALALQTDDGTVPSTTEDGGSMATGETVMCYVSEEGNQVGDGPATATQPVPFLITQ